MLDLQDRFINWLMSGFYESLQEDRQRYAERLTEAVKKGDKTDIMLYMGMIKETQGILNDLSDENMEIKDFVHLLAEKYGLKTEVKDA